jgi:hypothetical protein
MVTAVFTINNGHIRNETGLPLLKVSQTVLWLSCAGKKVDLLPNKR